MATNAKQKPTKTRKRRLNRRQTKKLVRQSDSISGSFRMLIHALKHLWQHRKLFGGILLVYLLLHTILVRGLALNFQLSDTQDTIEEALGNEVGATEKSFALFGALLGSAGSTTGEAASVYQVVLFVLLSLVIIWSLRQTFDNQKQIGLRRAFYSSTYPLIPYVLVGLVILLQLVPALIGLTVFGIVASNGIAVGALEQIIWLIVLLLGVAASIYWVSSSLFASYIVTLPDATPLAALRSARKLVKFRRWLIIRKVLFLPFIIFLCLAVIFLPLVLFVPALAEILFGIVSLLVLVVVHAYAYVLYRELL